MILVDGHVHIYGCFDTDSFFDAALRNFHEAQRKIGGEHRKVSYVLLLAEGCKDTWFKNIATAAKQRNVSTPADRWSFFKSEETLSLFARCTTQLNEEILIIAGKQVKTKENIEVLALFCDTDINDHMSIEETVRIIGENEGIPVFPWGAGKWIGKRKRFICDYLLGISPETVFLGDNGGRPSLWPLPELFLIGKDNNINLLPGSDPLPLADEAERVASYGFYITQGVLDLKSPARSLRNILVKKQHAISSFGELLSNSQFIFNQLRLRLPFGT